MSSIIAALGCLLTPVSSQGQALFISAQAAQGAGDLWIPMAFLQRVGLLPENFMALPAPWRQSMRPSAHGPALPLKAVEAQLRLRALRAGDQVYWLPPAEAQEPDEAATLSTSTGLHYGETRVSTSGGPTLVRILRVGDFQKNYQLTVLWPDGGLGTLAPLQDMAKGHGAVAAINANFYDPDTKFPIGLLLASNTLEREDYARRAALGVDVFGNLHFLNVAAEVHVKAAGQTLVADDVNRPAKADELVVLTPAFGAVLRLSQLATVIQVKGDRVVSIMRASVVIPDRQSTWVIATGTRQEQVENLKKGDALSLRPNLMPQPPWPLALAVSAGPMLVRDGRIVLDAATESFSQSFAQARTARSALGFTDDGTLMLVIVLKGNGSSGMTLEELARWMQGAGAKDALAFDGGGSASLAFRQGSTWRNVGGTRAIAVGLALVPR